MSRTSKPVANVSVLDQRGYPLEVTNLLLQDNGYGRSPMLFEFRFGTGGGCTLNIDGDKVAKAGGHGYCKQGVCLAQWFTKAFAEHLKQLFSTAKMQRQLKGSSSGPHEWYCLYRAEDGTISLNGMSGINNVISIMERSTGLTLRRIGETKESTLYLLARDVRRKERKTAK